MSRVSKLRFNIEEFDFAKDNESEMKDESEEEFDIYSENPYQPSGTKKPKKAVIQPKKVERLEPIFSSHQGSRTSRNPTSFGQYRSHTPGMFSRSKMSDTP